MALYIKIKLRYITTIFVLYKSSQKKEKKTSLTIVERSGNKCEPHYRCSSIVRWVSG